jgi:hypothetical protein
VKDNEVADALLAAARTIAASLPEDTDCILIMRRGENVYLTSNIEADRPSLIGLLWAATEQLRHGLEGQIVPGPKRKE